MLSLILFFLVLFLFSIQTTLIPLVEISGVTIDLALIFVVYCGIHVRGHGGATMGLLLGFVQDCFSGGLLGANTLSKSLLGFAFDRVKDKIMVEGVIPICFFIFFASLFDGLIIYWIHHALLKSSSGEFVIAPVLGYGLYNALLGPFFFHMMDTVKQRWFKNLLDKNATAL